MFSFRHDLPTWKGHDCFNYGRKADENSYWTRFYYQQLAFGSSYSQGPDVNALNFEITNKKGSGHKELSNSIGLKNITQQLKLSYGDYCKFVAEEKDIYY